MKLRVRVVGDGSVFGTRVFNADTDDEIQCAGVTLAIGHSGQPIIKIELLAFEGHEFLIGPQHAIDPNKQAAEPAVSR